jgi:cell division transport system ATP-binding protein
VIKFENVSKVFNSYSALQNINLSFNSGELVFLTGHSGAGKTTLLKLIMGLSKPSSGSIVVANNEVDKLNTWQMAQYRRQIGFIMQNPMLINTKTIFENVHLPLLISGADPAEAKRKVRAALDKVNLLTKERFYPESLSTGEQQRVAIARALVTKPNIILADEPTGNLDPVLSSEIMRLFEAFRQVGVCIIIATHDLALIARMKYRIVTLANGQLIGLDHEPEFNSEFNTEISYEKI